MGLSKYKQRRNFTKTSEPRGKVARSPEGNNFVIQKHAASRLHYDFRLELDGVLKSWAIPKGPSLAPGDKRLAVNVEDHPLYYLHFEGIIPQGEYGGGEVLVWDTGTWEPLEGDPSQNYKKGKLNFKLHGDKLHGKWTLVKLKHSDKGNEWLLLKDRDEYSENRDILKDRPESVISGKTIDALKGTKEVWGNSKSSDPLPIPKVKTQKIAPKKQPPYDASVIPGALASPLPKIFPPQLATLVETPPSGDDWIFEIKYDGYRLLCFKKGDRVRLLTRNGNDWTDKFGPLAKSCKNIPFEECILDGEAAIADNQGAGQFQELQNAFRAQNFQKLRYFVFDLPYCNGYSLLKTPLLERKALLAQGLSKMDKQGFVIYSEHIVGHGEDVFQSACEHKLEGIIGKKVDSFYERKRSKTWVKIKCGNQQEFVIGGYTDPGGARSGFGALLLGFYEGTTLTYCGKVGTGFDERLLKELYKKLNSLKTAQSPFCNLKKGKGVHWVRPELLGEVSFTQWTSDGRLRHPSFLGLREDKQAKEGKIIRSGWVI